MPCGMLRVTALLVSAALGLWVSGAASAGAVPFTVCPSGCPYSSIQAAVAAAGPGDTVAIQPGTYTEHLRLTMNVTLEGTGAVVDGGGSVMPGSVLIVERGVSATLHGLTITNGHSPDFGGGILNYGRLRLQDTQVVANSARADGGGIYNNGVLTLQDTQVSNNSTGGLDGGIANDIGTINVAGSVVANNAPSNCGGTALDSICQG